ncbi:hypothetical protein O181_001726 [Austropuccinia psidii MF-1]|uniref:Phosphatidylserine decarboxylase n=1 Tax=Austropuccinia psidii MF-1 TaxID=1389203 RepID=A0A9Q3GCP2_9BASI|nr:hypothetical protein [Austropuccinia psidii MF-1]
MTSTSQEASSANDNTSKIDIDIILSNTNSSDQIIIHSDHHHQNHQKSFKSSLLSKIKSAKSNSDHHSLSKSNHQNNILIETNPNLSIGTKPIKFKSIGSELSKEIGLETSNHSQINQDPNGSSPCSDSNLNALLNQNFSNKPNPNNPIHQSNSPNKSLNLQISNLKGALKVVKKIPNGLRSHSPTNHPSSSSNQILHSKPQILLDPPLSNSINLDNPQDNQSSLFPSSKFKPNCHLNPLKLNRKSKSNPTSSIIIKPADDIIGLCYIEVNRAAGLPYWKAVTRISFDMDPFTIISFGHKIFRTRVISHSLDPVWDEKMFFHVRKHEMSYSILFHVFDWDKMSSNDYIGENSITMTDLITKTEENLTIDPETGLYKVDDVGKLMGDQLINYELPIVQVQSSISKTSSPSKDHTKSIINPQTEVICNGSLFVKAKFIPYSAMRQVFWRKYLQHFDTDDSHTISNTELSSMLDSLGSTLTHETIASFFSRFGKSSQSDLNTLSFEQVITCLESQLVKPLQNKFQIDLAKQSTIVNQPETILSTNIDQDDQDNQVDNEDEDYDNSSVEAQTPLAIPLGFIGHNSLDTTLPLSTPSASPAESPTEEITLEDISIADSNSAKNQHFKLEKVVNISQCPICHKQFIGSLSEIDVVTHIAVCASQDWSSLDTILSPGNFVTSSQAHRKWFTKVVAKVQNGRYSLGADSANIIVQDRQTGKLIEEKMQAYVRLGIRLMYKVAGSKDRMENQRMKRLLRSLTIKQGIKYNSPESIKEIGPFIAFHRLDLAEVKLPLEEFKTFNEFFYRELNPNSRPIESAQDSSILTSCADCRMMVFDGIDNSRKIWIKARVFSLGKLLGPLGKKNTDKITLDRLETREMEQREDFDQESKWSLAIFRLAPQDYHRFHAPIDGIVEEMQFIEGQYYTVNPMAIRSTIDVYGENVRVVMSLSTKSFGKIYCIFVGAMMVGSIKMTIKVGDRVTKGQDIGYFAFGGSTILTVIQSEKIEWDEDLKTNSSRSIETLVRVGTRVGKLK